MVTEALQRARELEQPRRPATFPDSPRVALADLPNAEFVVEVKAAHRDGRLPDVADEVFHANCHRRDLLNEDLLAAVKKAAEDSLVADVRTWARQGKTTEAAVGLWGREQRLLALIEDHSDLRANLNEAAKEKELADARARGIAVVKPQADVCVWTDERLPFDQLRTRRPLRSQMIRPRQRNRRRRRPASRVRGSRRGLSRSSSRGGDSGDDSSGDPEPGERVLLDERPARRPCR